MHLYVQSVNAIHVCVPKTSIPQNVKNCSGRKFGGALRLHQSFLCKTFLLSYTQLPICLTGFYYTTRVQRKIKTYSKRRTKILRKLLSVRSRSSYLLHSCSTGTETSRHFPDPQQNWVTLIGDDLLQEHDWKSVFDNRHLAIYNVKHIRWLMRPSELLIHAEIYFAPAPFLWGVCFQDIDRNNICWPTKHWFPKEVDIVCESSTKLAVHKFQKIVEVAKENLTSEFS